MQSFQSDEIQVFFYRVSFKFRQSFGIDSSGFELIITHIRLKCFVNKIISIEWYRPKNFLKSLNLFDEQTKESTNIDKTWPRFYAISFFILSHPSIPPLPINVHLVSKTFLKKILIKFPFYLIHILYFIHLYFSYFYHSKKCRSWNMKRTQFSRII